RTSAQFRRRNASVCVFISEARNFGTSTGFEASDEASRVRNPDGRPFNARRISSRPRRSAIKIVAELKLFVDSSSSLRRRGGTSLTDRYTCVFPPLAMKIVEVFT